jgi:hypothetical protein
MRYMMCFLFLITIVGCRRSSAQVPREPIQVLTPQTPAPDISSTLAVLPSSPNLENSRIVLQAFFDSYNRHDLAGVLATLAETFAYGDCDFATRQMRVFETIQGLTAWLRFKFAEGDQFRVEDMIIAPAEGSPASDPLSTAVQVSRTNETLEKMVQEKQSLFKIILNAEGNRVQYLNTYGNVDCEAGR